MVSISYLEKVVWGKGTYKWVFVLNHNPGVFHSEEKMRAILQRIGFGILWVGFKKPLTLEEFKVHVESNPDLAQIPDWGALGIPIEPE
ncbi:MAG: hypothetical protein ABIJ82_01730 [Patescibacteria group bacterium]